MYTLSGLYISHSGPPGIYWKLLPTNTKINNGLMKFVKRKMCCSISLVCPVWSSENKHRYFAISRIFFVILKICSCVGKSMNFFWIIISRYIQLHISRLCHREYSNSEQQKFALTFIFIHPLEIWQFSRNSGHFTIK